MAEGASNLPLFGLATVAGPYLLKENSMMNITSIQIQANHEPNSKVKATAEVVLNGSLSLRGIKILRGRYGLFLAFPGLQAGSRQRAFEALSMRFRQELQSEVLNSYKKYLAPELALFT